MFDGEAAAELISFRGRRACDAGFVADDRLPWLGAECGSRRRMNNYLSEETAQCHLDRQSNPPRAENHVHLDGGK